MINVPTVCVCYSYGLVEPRYGNTTGGRYRSTSHSALRHLSNKQRKLSNMKTTSGNVNYNFYVVKLEVTFTLLLMHL